jgi:hypothetical protein
VLVKYYGLVLDENSQKETPRCEFLYNGLFRMTQPKYLNDKGSEAKLFPYFNEFSPADIAWARKQHDKIQRNTSYEPSIKELENQFLKPAGLRYGDQVPHMVKQQTGFDSMNEYDNDQFTQSVERVNSFIIEALSCSIGILSLAKSDSNELMWTHYASEGKGLAVCFNENHLFFKKFVPKGVSYISEKRATFTYYKGSMRINGNPIKNLQVSDFKNPFSMFRTLSEQGVNILDMTERLLYSKAKQWVSEEEVRLVCPLSFCEQEKGKVVDPKFEVTLPDEFLNLFPSYFEINLKQIPFDAFESIVLGYAISEKDKESIINKVKANPLLSHVKLKVARHNIYGDVETVDLVL